MAMSIAPWWWGTIMATKSVSTSPEGVMCMAAIIVLIAVSLSERNGALRLAARDVPTLTRAPAMRIQRIRIFPMIVLTFGLSIGPAVRFQAVHQSGPHHSARPRPTVSDPEVCSRPSWGESILGECIPLDKRDVPAGKSESGRIVVA